MKFLENFEVLVASIVVGAISGFVVTVNKVKGKLRLADTMIAIVTSAFLGFMTALALDTVVEPKTQLFVAAIAGAGGYPLFNFLIDALKVAIATKITDQEHLHGEILKKKEEEN